MLLSLVPIEETGETRVRTDCLNFDVFPMHTSQKQISIRAGFPTGGKFYLLWGKFNDAEVTILRFFSAALVTKQKTGGKFYVRKLARGKLEKKV